MESPNANEKQTAEEIAAGWSFYAERTTEPVRHKTQRVRIVRGTSEQTRQGQELGPGGGCCCGVLDNTRLAVGLPLVLSITHLQCWTVLTGVLRFFIAR
jgi:hypothetical protein